MRKLALVNHRFELIAFCTGASVMILEIVGARLIAPYFGTSTFVWTAMIGVILGALAGGYALGGRMADNDKPQESLTKLLLSAAFFVLLLGLMQEPVLSWLADRNFDLRLSSLLAALLLFAVPSLLIGMVSPHLAKIRITSLATSGKSVGRLEAAGALGSIAGTFLCGYLLLGLFGSRAIVFGVAGLLIVTSLIAAVRTLAKVKAMLAIGLVLCIPATQTGNAIADIDSSYARYQVKNFVYGGEEIVALTMDNSGLQSGMSKQDPDRLVFSYIQQFDAALRRMPNTESILVVGGGTFTFPAAAARNHPDLQVDVVEIDPRLTDISEQYFGLQKPSNLHIINEDGRTYLNRNAKKYDMIFMDAYNAVSPPFQVTTQQALQRIRASLTPNGVLVSNVIGRYDAYFDPYLQAMQATAGSVFAYKQAIPADQRLGSPGQLRNYILFASQSEDAFMKVIGDIGVSPISSKPDSLILRDDYAPIERLIN